MKKVLIIGANSYIGNSFIQYIEQLQESQIQIDEISGRNGEWEKYDFTSYNVVLHLAGIAHRRESKQNAVDYYSVNRDLAINIAKKAKESKVGQFIFMSTAAVYGSHVSIITKDTIPHPNTHYGMSKLEAEQEIIDLHSNDYKVAIVRPPMVYGYGCKGNFKRLLKLAKITPIFPDIQNKRSIIYIENLCEFLRLLTLQEEWGYFHPQNAEYVCTSEMVKVIGESLGRKIYFTKALNWCIQILLSRIGMLSKIFGDLYYELAEDPVISNKLIEQDKSEIITMNSKENTEYQVNILELDDTDKRNTNLTQTKYQVINYYESIKKSIF